MVAIADIITLGLIVLLARMTRGSKVREAQNLGGNQQ
jgi:hypothetical protein